MGVIVGLANAGAFSAHEFYRTVISDPEPVAAPAFGT